MLVACVLGLAGCGSAPTPTWIQVRGAVLHYPAERIAVHGSREAGQVALVHDQGRSELEIPIGRGQWQREREHGLWYVPLFLRLPSEKERLRLVTPAGTLPRLPVAELARGGQPGFNFRKDALVLGGFAEVPPESATLLCSVPLSPMDGDRFQRANFAGRGPELLPGLRASCTLDLPVDSVLRFGTSFEPLLDGLADSGGVVFRIRLDGELLFEHRAEGAPAGCAWHFAPLPRNGRRAARLEFELDGDMVHGSFVDPVVGPREIGAPGRRPWDESRPDVVVFLADTFRADNLTACGGEVRVTPNLDALAERGLCFVQARSTATWTLPAHATLFSGLYPPQVLVSGAGAEHLTEAVETIAERLASAGYRTGAVTDGGFVSSLFGLDQGFGSFAELTENAKDLPRLLESARAFLEADDGRPTFLFAQTYHAHWPYQVSPRARAEHGERLGIRGEAGELFERIVREAHALGATEIDDVTEMESLPSSPEMERLAAELHAHYLGGVADLDHELAGFLAYLGERGLLDTGYFVFTSDHGEGFFEHGALFHSSDPFEEQARIPLLIAGRGLAGAHIDAPVSLVDVAPTLAEMAGITADPGWPGRSLLAAGSAAPRPLFGFESSDDPEGGIFVLEGQRKLLLTHVADRERLTGAFDLARDASETRDEASSGASWPQELLQAHAAALRAILVPLVESDPLELDSAKLEELRGLGY